MIYVKQPIQHLIAALLPLLKFDEHGICKKDHTYPFQSYIIYPLLVRTTKNDQLYHPLEKS